MTVTTILSDPQKSWEQKAHEVATAYNKIAQENNWLRTKMAAMEAKLALWFERLGDSNS